ncbi:sodium channel modifier 1 [Cocos nucifera]|uniref:Sodium channel modifier 1 n=1 Tax=Cocos nucifera TaxID=13894 RepID=A0A8K0I899_COCNU|nr:sodium channel modifier 1 [Cocos nucifera]
MSVFGGDSWAREAQHRKRRVDDLLLSSPSSSFKKLSNGKYACLVCPHNPILDSPLMLSMHNKGSRHIAAESRLSERELSRKEELSKRIALSAESADASSIPNSSPKLKSSDIYNKPLIKQTQKAILETQCNKYNDLNAVHVMKSRPNVSFYDSKPSPSCNYVIESSTSTVLDDSNHSDKKYVARAEKDAKVLADRNVELRKRHEKELKFTAAGWKRDCHGKWYRDENVEFDSDEEDPNVCLG